MIPVWMVRTVAVLDVLLGVTLWAVDNGLPVSTHPIDTLSDPSSQLMIPAALCIALGVMIVALDRYSWTRPAAVMAVFIQLAGVVAALGYSSLVWLLG